ncbi:hypothetical protein G6F60_014784 [Rhizopus arrhizus]|nr:hypothetical protein G6F60_014784 [Rhizopus arrhizus]
MESPRQPTYSPLTGVPALASTLARNRSKSVKLLSVGDALWCQPLMNTTTGSPAGSTASQCCRRSNWPGQWNRPASSISITMRSLRAGASSRTASCSGQ